MSGPGTAAVPAGMTLSAGETPNAACFLQELQEEA